MRCLTKLILIEKAARRNGELKCGFNEAVIYQIYPLGLCELSLGNLSTK